MYIYKKTVKVQLLLFTAFFLMGAHLLIEHFLGEKAPWMFYILLGIFVIMLIYGIIIYRNKQTETVNITKKQIDLIRYTLYAYFGVYILQMLLTNLDSIPQDVMRITTSVILMLLALFGIVVQTLLLVKNRTKRQAKTKDNKVETVDASFEEKKN